jgi:hypothetical protein
VRAQRRNQSLHQRRPIGHGFGEGQPAVVDNVPQQLERLPGQRLGESYVMTSRT